MNNGSSNGSNGKNGDHSALEFPEDFFVLVDSEDFLRNESGHQGFAQLPITHEIFESEGSSDGSTGYFRKRPFRYIHPLWNLGWTDGRLGQPRDTNEALLIARGKLRQNQRIQVMTARLSVSNKRFEEVQLQITRLRELLTGAISRHVTIVNERAGRFHEFSYGLGAFYVFVALVLFLSDIPLTLKLVAKGFDLKTEVKNPLTGEVLYGVDHLLVQTSAVVSQLWEPLCLALGIALAGVFIKIFLDDVIFRDASEVRRKRIAFTLSLIAVTLFGTIVVLGVFRSQIQNNLVQNEIDEIRLQQEQRLRDQGVSADLIPGLLGEPTARQESTIEIITFVLLTITLPLVAGACFSAGWRRIKDTQRYHQSKKDLKEAERNLEKASSTLYSVVSEIETAETWLKLNAPDQVMDTETQQELSMYRHGYFRGMNVPETIDHGLTLYDRVQRSAQKILAKRLKERIWADAQPQTR